MLTVKGKFSIRKISPWYFMYVAAISSGFLHTGDGYKAGKFIAKDCISAINK